MPIVILVRLLISCNLLSSTETRNKGKATKRYTETQDDASEDDEGNFKRRRINSTSPSRSTRSHPASQPPLLHRTNIHDQSDDDDEEDDEYSNKPGPSSRLMQTSRTTAGHSPQKSSKLAQHQVIHNALDDDDDEDEDESEEGKGSDESEDEENSDDSDDDDNEVSSSQRRTGRRGEVGGSQQKLQRRPLRQRQNVSEDDNFEVSPTSRKSKVG